MPHNLGVSRSPPCFARMFEIPALSLPISVPRCVDLHGTIGLALVERDSDVMTKLLEDWSHPAEQPYGLPSRRARALLRHLLHGEIADCRERAILRNQDGSPALKTQPGETMPAVSISHSGSMIAVAYGRLAGLGIDVELHRRDRDIDGIAALAFGQEERRLVGEHGPEAFYRIWTAREALSKATGRAFTQVVDRQDYFTDLQTEVTQLVIVGRPLTILHARPSDRAYLALGWQSSA